MYDAYQTWASKTYGDSAKTKTVTQKKYDRIVKILRGEESSSVENSKFRFWVKVKGFKLGPLRREDFGKYGYKNEREILYVPSNKPAGSSSSAAKSIQTTEANNDEIAYKRVAVVENFYNIIYNVHVEMDGRSGKHAGQKRTYRAVAEMYAFLPREAVTRFLMSCSDCQKRMHLQGINGQCVNKASNGPVRKSQTQAKKENQNEIKETKKQTKLMAKLSMEELEYLQTIKSSSLTGYNQNFKNEDDNHHLHPSHLYHLQRQNHACGNGFNSDAMNNFEIDTEYIYNEEKNFDEGGIIVKDNEIMDDDDDEDGEDAEDGDEQDGEGDDEDENECGKKEFPASIIIPFGCATSITLTEDKLRSYKQEDNSDHQLQQRGGRKRKAPIAGKCSSTLTSFNQNLKIKFTRNLISQSLDESSINNSMVTDEASFQILDSDHPNAEHELFEEEHNAEEDETDDLSEKIVADEQQPKNDRKRRNTGPGKRKRACGEATSRAKRLNDSESKKKDEIDHEEKENLDKEFEEEGELDANRKQEEKEGGSLDEEKGTEETDKEGAGEKIKISAKRKDEREEEKEEEKTQHPAASSSTDSICLPTTATLPIDMSKQIQNNKKSNRTTQRKSNSNGVSDQTSDNNSNKKMKCTSSSAASLMSISSGETASMGLATSTTTAIKRKLMPIYCDGKFTTTVVNEKIKDEDEDEEDEEEIDAVFSERSEHSGHDPERLKAFNMFVRLFVDENLDRMVPISRQPKDKIQAIMESCSRQFPEFSDRSRKRIRTYLKSCRRNRRNKAALSPSSSSMGANSGLMNGVNEHNRITTSYHLTSAMAEQILANACENEYQNAKRMRVGLQPLPAATSSGTVLVTSMESNGSNFSNAYSNPSVLMKTNGSNFYADVSSIPKIDDNKFVDNKQNEAKLNRLSSLSSSSAAILASLPSSSSNALPSSLSSSSTALPCQPIPSSSSLFINNLSSNSNNNNSQTLASILPRITLNPTEQSAIKQLITGYRESAAFLLRSADELENLLLNQA